MTTARRPRQVKHSVLHQWLIKLETALICEYVIGFRSMQCGWVSTSLPPYRSYLQRLALMHAFVTNLHFSNRFSSLFYQILKRDEDNDITLLYLTLPYLTLPSPYKTPVTRRQVGGFYVTLG